MGVCRSKTARTVRAWEKAMSIEMPEAKLFALIDEYKAALERSHLALAKQQQRTRKARKQRDEAMERAYELAKALRKIYGS